jgi:hypothetical protein
MIEFFALLDRNQAEGIGQREAALCLPTLCPGSGRSGGARVALQQGSILRLSNHIVPHGSLRCIAKGRKREWRSFRI